MSFVYKVVQDLVDDVLDRVKRELDDYANTAKVDVEQFVDRIVQRVVKAMVPAVLGIVLVSAGLIFSLVALVAYLSTVVSPALAWGIVGLGVAGIGTVLILSVFRRHGSRGMKHVSHPEHRN
jgi:hypothetical protein